ncbi:uncharacterized protein LOC123628813 [Lemur catta]|uniref:uncharacterized protein LOC123628813 n=1 Tax=Lemur catta TaxID=9447 RepID=UPI001E26AC04|nr:uncharacterized protein LOC123628813 [Lemur catta]
MTAAQREPGEGTKIPATTSLCAQLCRKSGANLVVPRSGEVTMLIPNLVRTPDGHSAPQSRSPGLQRSSRLSLPAPSHLPPDLPPPTPALGLTTPLTPAPGLSTPSHACPGNHRPPHTLLAGSRPLPESLRAPLAGDGFEQLLFSMSLQLKIPSFLGNPCLNHWIFVQGATGSRRNPPAVWTTGRLFQKVPLPPRPPRNRRACTNPKIGAVHPAGDGKSRKLAKKAGGPREGPKRFGEESQKASGRTELRRRGPRMDGNHRGLRKRAERRMGGGALQPRLRGCTERTYGGKESGQGAGSDEGGDAPTGTASWPTAAETPAITHMLHT